MGEHQGPGRAVSPLGAALDRPAPPRLRASWQRSRSYGVSPDRVEPVFTGAVDTDSLFFECGEQVLRGLHATLGTEPVSLMIADRDGLVLSRIGGDPSITASLDRVHLAPGFYFTERNAGTNGLGLSLADRAPTLVRADEHYCSELQGYTCAAVPVIDPLLGELAGSVNLTTWSRSSSELLLALAQSAAQNTAALMLVRAGGHRPRPMPRGEVFHAVTDRLPPPQADPCTSAAWRRAVDEIRLDLAAGRTVAVVGEPGAGKATAFSLARRAVVPRERLLHARAPAGDDVGAWLAMWEPELGDRGTCVVVRGADRLPAWAAGELAAGWTALRRSPGPVGLAVTATEFAALPEALAAVVDAVVEVPALAVRPEDVVPLARWFAGQERRREVGLTPAAARALTGFSWPGNASQLRGVVREAARRADLIDVRHLPPELFAGAAHPWTRLEVMERDEIVRCLSESPTVVAAAHALGMSRATLYRKLARYDITMPHRSGG